MLAWFRKLLKNWVARVAFAALGIGFVFWGISNVLTLVSSQTAVAHIGGRPVDMSVVQGEYQKELNQASQNGDPAPDLAGRQQIAQAALATVLRQQALALAEGALGVVAPDAVVQAKIYAIPAFQTNGAFDKAKFDALLAQNNYAPDQFVDQEKSNIANQQMIEAITGGVAPPAPLTQQIFDFVAQARTAETVDIRIADQPAPPAPPPAVLQRFWKNHPQMFSAPEYRTIKLVLLAASVLAPNEPVGDGEIAAAYARTAAQNKVAATRSVQVVTVADEARASRLAAAWRAGADWTAVRAKAAKLGAAAVALDHAQKNQLPSAALGDAVFAAAPRVVTGPVQGPLGYFVFTVTDAVAGGAPPLAAVAGQIKQALQLQKAQAEVDQDVDNVQDALAGQTPLDKLPGNLDLTAVEGTLDANGNTLDGTAAPIPGGDKLRDAVVKAVFAGHVGDPAQLITGPDGNYFAFTIDSVTPASVKPYDQVQAPVAAAWQLDAQTRAADAKAATLLQAVNAGAKFEAAAAAAGVAATINPPLTRGGDSGSLPPAMAQVLFTMQPGQATMQQSADGFLVASLQKIDQPPMAQAPQAAAGILQGLTKSLQSDVAGSFLSGQQTLDHMSVDPKLFAQIYQ